MSELNPYQPPGAVIAAEVPSSVVVRVTGLLSVDDAINALRAAGKWQRGRVALLAAILMILVGMLVLVLLQQDASLTPIALFVVLSTLYFIARPSILRWNFARTWNACPEHRQSISWTFSDDGLYVETSNSKYLHAWRTYLYAKITAREIVLAHHSNAMFNFIPIRFFAAEQDLAAVQQLIADKLPLR